MQIKLSVCAILCYLAKFYSSSSKLNSVMYQPFFPHPKMWRKRNWKSVPQICLWTPIASGALRSQGHTACWWLKWFLEREPPFFKFNITFLHATRYLSKMTGEWKIWLKAKRVNIWPAGLSRRPHWSVSLYVDKNPPSSICLSRSAFIHFPEVWIFFPLSPCRQAAKTILALLVFACWAENKPTEF